MATTEYEYTAVRPRVPSAETASARQGIRPVLPWAVLGGGFTLLSIYVFTRWIAAGLHRTPNGPSHIPGLIKVGDIIWQAGGCLGAVLALYYFLYRPWRRERRLTTDGMFLIGYVFYFWQDPLANLTGITFTYNTNMLNFGSWAPYIPLWNSPNASRSPEPLLSTGAMYVWVFLVAIIVSNRLMDRVRARWPQLGTASIVGLFLAFFWILDLVWERVFMQLFATWTYPGAAHGWATLWKGHYYQYPIFEMFAWGSTWAVWAMVRYFKNDQGETFVERGVTQLRTGAKAKTFARLLAISGMINVISIAVCYIPYSFYAQHQATWPKDIVNRSYLVGGVCGPGTSYGCPGYGVPIAGENTAHLSPNGKLVVPGALNVPKFTWQYRPSDHLPAVRNG
jgi:Spirocyclase AveC-like